MREDSSIVSVCLTRIGANPDDLRRYDIARRDGKRITADMYPQRSSVAFDVAAAGERLDESLRRSSDVGHDLQRGFQALGQSRCER